MKKGFTLIELIIVIVVLGIGVSVIVPFILGLFSSEVSNTNLPTAPSSYSAKK